MLSLKYTCALLAGMILALLAFSAGVETVTPLAADDDPFAVFAASAGETPASIVSPQRFDDGLKLAGGAFVQCPDPEPTRSVVVATPCVTVRTICVARSVPVCRDTWWTRGPVRRVISYPVRVLVGRARARRAVGR